MQLSAERRIVGTIIGVALAAGIVACDATQEFNFNPPASTFTAESARVDNSEARVLIARVDSAFFASSEAPLHPLLGRMFVAADFGMPQDVAILSNEYFSRHFGAAPDIIGSTVEVDSVQVTIVGVMPPGVDQPPGVSFWIARD
jgi:hypothetical protein